MLIKDWNTSSLRKALSQVEARLNDLSNIETRYAQALLSFSFSIQDELDYRAS
jgi:hypothetical protein